MLKAVAAFGVGYVLGSKAGRERYAEIRTLAQKLATQLEQRQREASRGATRST